MNNLRLCTSARWTQHLRNIKALQSASVVDEEGCLCLCDSRVGLACHVALRVLQARFQHEWHEGHSLWATLELARRTRFDLQQPYCMVCLGQFRVRRYGVVFRARHLRSYYEKERIGRKRRWTLKHRYPHEVVNLPDDSTSLLCPLKIALH